MELLLGCGASRDKRMSAGTGAEWKQLVTLDRYAECNPDILWDLEQKPWPLEEGSFDEIHAYEVLEHLGRQGDWKAFFDDFGEIYRALKPGGLLFATVPSIQSRWLWGDPSHTRVISKESLTFLDASAYENVGKTAMSDFRWYWKGDLKLVHQQDDGERFVFVLKKG